MRVHVPAKQALAVFNSRDRHDRVYCVCFCLSLCERETGRETARARARAVDINDPFLLFSRM